MSMLFAPSLDLIVQGITVETNKQKHTWGGWCLSLSEFRLSSSTASRDMLMQTHEISTVWCEMRLYLKSPLLF